MKGKYQDSSVGIKVIQWLGVMALLTVVAMGVWLIVPCNHNSTAALKWFQLVLTVGTFLLPPLICAWLWSEKPWEWLGLKWDAQIPVSRYCGIFTGAVVLMVVAMPGINLIADWNSKMELPACMAGVEAWMKAQETAARELTERFLSGTDFGALLINIGLMALLPACAEELTFRGVLQGIIVGNRKTAVLNVRSHVAVWVSAILFSAVHMQFYGFVPRMLFGALFGYMFVWTGCLWVPIVMHFTNNAITVVAYWVIYRNGINPETIENFGTGDTAWVGWISLGLAVAGVYFFWRRSRQISNASSRMS